MMHEIRFDQVKKFLDAHLLFNTVSFHITGAERVGIVGNNGTGKTTILKLIAGMIQLRHCAGYPYAPVPPGYDEGWVKVTKNTSTAYLEQVPKFDSGETVYDVLNSSFSALLELEAQLRRLEGEMTHLKDVELTRTLENYSRLTQEYEVKGGYETEEKLKKVCTGLKFNDEFLSSAFERLSGGEKKIVLLGKLLIETPDVLLLDEPTNHLDMESVEWLQTFINSYKGIVVIVSHDRYFLDKTVNKIVALSDKRCKTYHGNYTDFIRQREEERLIQSNKYKQHSKEISQIKGSIKELKRWADKADNSKFNKRAASLEIKLDKMKKVEKVKTQNRTMQLDIASGSRSGNSVIEVTDLCKKFGDRVLFEHANMHVMYGDKVALIGPNGSGKSTFVKMLLNELEQDKGEIRLGASTKIAYLPQNLVFEDENDTVLECFCDDLKVLEGKAREHLARFMFYGGNVHKKIRHLSGGERIRLKLSKLFFENVNTIILDEPTNHLDIEAIESIESALADFKGTLLFISHDRYFINRMCNRIVALEEKKLVNYLGDYDDYKSSCLIVKIRQ
ncbi:MULTISPECIES: ribosomal protection-like ABC-F family protein [unclassified Fusibacter]|uniref:ribosomal protection-like ABC-F family protein n=1 Tax=unclassified Fusibacter TaxID=2624464 RepID=UPI0013E96D3F|nr:MULTISPECIES: ABC-F family ATP-binding cassette domain-containing protein [unclassified Fusibacter]MCK8059497.1 ATP-binding cassette domain-containing protein [Fusibacter sp. A2]NPE21039.1 ABC-F family ATP-binding cassette domain-containing protein [Fusibacter sp. A1]